MNAKSTSRRRGDSNGADAPHEDAARTERRAQTFDNVVQRWRHGCVKESLNSELGASGALLRGAQALRTMQADAAERTRVAHERAQAELASARSLPEVASLGLRLAQEDTQAALGYWSETMNIAVRSAVEGWSDALNALAKAQGLAGETSRHWLECAAQARPAETGEAEPTSAAVGAPLLWPAPQTMRDAMALGARTWNDWLAALPSAAPSGQPEPAAH